MRGGGVVIPSSWDFSKWVNCLDALHKLRLRVNLPLAIRSGRAVEYVPGVCSEVVPGITKGLFVGRGHVHDPQKRDSLQGEVLVTVSKNWSSCCFAKSDKNTFNDRSK